MKRSFLLASLLATATEAADIILVIEDVRVTFASSEDGADGEHEA